MILEFAAPQYLYLLWTIPLGIGAIVWSILRGNRLRKKFADTVLYENIMPEKSIKRNIWRYGFLLAAYTSLIIMLSGPRSSQSRPMTSSEDHKGIDLVFCIDVSNSMRSRDLAPDRLSFAKQVATYTTNRIQGSRIGIVVFAGSSFIRLPLTSDLAIVKEMIADITPEVISTQGTDLASALRLASKSFSTKAPSSKAIVLLTDGEDHEGGVEDALKAIKDRKISLYTIAVGSEKGSPIPVDNDYLKDESGKEVLSQVNLDMIKQISEKVEGEWWLKSSAREMSAILLRSLDKLPKINLGNAQNTKYELFPWLALLAIIFLWLSEIVMPRKSRVFTKMRLF